MSTYFPRSCFRVYTAFMKRILIIEDNVGDLGYYAPLFGEGREVSFLFFSHEPEFDIKKLEDLVEMTHEGLFKKVKKYYVRDKETIVEFLKETPFDFYIVDSLAGFAKGLPRKASLPKNKTAFFTSTEDFKTLMESKGYKAYKKNEMERLMEENEL